MLYSCFIHLYTLAIRLAAAAGNEKAGQWVAGRKQLLHRIAGTLKPGERRFWVHCASLGEFEQGRPLIEALRDAYPDHKVVLTFFSPSGYEIRKNYALADYIWYLPTDTPAHARRFVRLVQPEKVFFIKYEFWRNMLFTLHRNQIPTFLVSANFRPDQLFFKWYGGWYRRVLHTFTHLFVQNDRSLRLLQQAGIRQVTVTGDTRFDRVCRIASEAPAIAHVAQFAQDGPCVVAGSSWPPDEALLTEYINTSERPVKWIIAPHEIDEGHVGRIMSALRKKAVRFTKIRPGEDLTQYEVLVIDNMGMLSAVYQYGQIAYIGGGFGRGIHNTLEAAVYGMPVIFGPAHTGFQEAVDLKACGGARSISNYTELKDCLDNWLDHDDVRKEAGSRAGAFVGQGKGATAAVLKVAFACLLTLLVLSGCSTQRNTPTSRAYHSLTTKYNILFNATTHYKTGVKTVMETYREDYAQILPLFPGETTGLPAEGTGADEFETAIQKAENAIALHSIKAKPDIGRRDLTEAEQRFYAQNEFNPYIKDCYLLTGQAYFFLQDYYNAIKTFDRITELFPHETVLYESERWRIKSWMAQQHFKQAQDRLTSLLDDRNLPDKAYKAELELLQADLFIQTGDHDRAMTWLGDLQHNRHIPAGTRQRVVFILAQLYAEKGDLLQADLLYKRVAHSRAPYDMRFAAQMACARNMAARGEQETVRQNLQLMARRLRNQSHLNQIYFTLAEILSEEGLQTDAVGYYRQAAALSPSDNPLRAEACRQVADFFFDQKNYAGAGPYYDSTLQAMQPSHARYADIKERSKKLNLLLGHLETIAREDSLQRFAALPETVRDSLIDLTIEAIAAREQAEAEAEEARLKQYYSQRSRQRTSVSAASDNQWYFYNNAAKARGAEEFSARWGKRSLEDDWRRANRSVVYSNVDEDDAAVRTDTTEMQERVTDKHAREYYVQDLPLTEEAMERSHARIRESLAGSADLYATFLHDTLAAIAQYDTLLARYPGYENAPYVLFTLARMHEGMGRSSEAAGAAERLKALDAESIYARMLDDPSYVSRMNARRETAEQWYRATYQKYQQWEDDAVVAMADQAFNLFATDESMPRFAYLRALAASRRSQRIDTLRLEMQQVIDEYPGTEVAEAATDILKTFGKYTSSGEMTESLAAATADTTGYTCDRTETQAFCWYLSGEENLNQIVFDLENHHADFYPEAGLELEQAELPQEATLLVVTPCMTPANAEAYYRQFMAEQPTGHLRGQPVCFLITESDLALLREAGTIRAYLHCFETRFDDLFHPAP